MNNNACTALAGVFGNYSMVALSGTYIRVHVQPGAPFSSSTSSFFRLLRAREQRRQEVEVGNALEW